MENKKRELYDLEERTFRFAQDVRNLIKQVPKTLGNQEDGKQVIRSSGSIGANYIEAQEYTGVKDRVHRIKISRKEAKESRFWLKLLYIENSDQENERKRELKKELGGWNCSIMASLLNVCILNYNAL